MSEKQKLEVRIAGRDYTLISEENPEYIHRVAFYVDQKMKEIEENYPRLSISMAAILTALNIGEDYLKEREEGERLKELLENKEEELMLQGKEKEDLCEQLNTLRTQYQALQIRFAKKETELENTIKNFGLDLKNNNISFDDLT